MPIYGLLVGSIRSSFITYDLNNLVKIVNEFLKDVQDDIVET